ncbi:nuclear transport factor 2 family protein [Aquimarina macrocephali]|uniref:nuclear transport factor 2 family protein n=1 Tax=Aquimarina macrocephali TaxID=666563 RepID=UPI000465EBE1|nr:nuclear transport factor 2 family protein [Aquimarina macrocephali]
MNPEKIVQDQLDAYNDRNLPDFLSFYTADIKIYNFLESEPFIDNISKLKEVYQDVFENSPKLRATITNRIVFGNKVIDREQVTGRKGVGFNEVVVIYEIENDLISKVHFIRKR